LNLNVNGLKWFFFGLTV